MTAPRRTTSGRIYLTGEVGSDGTRHCARTFRLTAVWLAAAVRAAGSVTAREALRPAPAVAWVLVGG